jgi:DNA polymerase III delta prime subunit
MPQIIDDLNVEIIPDLDRRSPWQGYAYLGDITDLEKDNMIQVLRAGKNYTSTQGVVNLFKTAIGQSKRLFWTTLPLTLANQQIANLAFILPTVNEFVAHDYKKYKYLKKPILQKFMQKIYLLYKDKLHLDANFANLINTDTQAYYTKLLHNLDNIETFAPPYYHHQHIKHYDNGRLIEFSAEQTNIVNLVDTNSNLIISGQAGSGKTSVMIEIIKKLLEENQDNPNYKILYVTISHKLIEAVKANLNYTDNAKLNFISYDELYLNTNQQDILGAGWQKLGITEFKAFLNSIPKTSRPIHYKDFIENITAMYEEMNTVAAYVEYGKTAEYLNLGIAQTRFHNVPKRSQEIIAIYSAYRQHLQNIQKPLKKYDPNFGRIERDPADEPREEVTKSLGREDLAKSSGREDVTCENKDWPREPTYDAILGDEMHLCSFMQVLQILALLKTNGHSSLIIDPQQGLDNALSLRDEVRRLLPVFRPEDTREITLHKLHTNYRCPPDVLELIQSLKRMQNILCGVNDKLERPEDMPLSPYDGPRTSISRYPVEHKLDPSLLNNFVVITTEELLSTAKNKFKDAVAVLTPKDAMGLGFNNIIVYRLFDSINVPEIAEIDLSKSKIGRIKEKSPTLIALLAKLKTIISGLMRLQEGGSLYIFQDDKLRHLGNLYQILTNLQATEHHRVQTMSREDFFAIFEARFKQGHIAEAKEIFVKFLGNAEDFYSYENSQQKPAPKTIYPSFYEYFQNNPLEPALPKFLNDLKKAGLISQYFKDYLITVITKDKIQEFHNVMTVISSIKYPKDIQKPCDDLIERYNTYQGPLKTKYIIARLLHITQIDAGKYTKNLWQEILSLATTNNNQELISLITTPESAEFIINATSDESGLNIIHAALRARNFDLLDVLGSYVNIGDIADSKQRLPYFYARDDADLVICLNKYTAQQYQRKKYLLPAAWNLADSNIINMLEASVLNDKPEKEYNHDPFFKNVTDLISTENIPELNNILKDTASMQMQTKFTLFYEFIKISLEKNKSSAARSILSQYLAIHLTNTALLTQDNPDESLAIHNTISFFITFFIFTNEYNRLKDFLMLSKLPLSKVVVLHHHSDVFISIAILLGRDEMLKILLALYGLKQNLAYYEQFLKHHTPDTQKFLKSLLAATEKQQTLGKKILTNKNYKSYLMQDLKAITQDNPEILLHCNIDYKDEKSCLIAIMCNEAAVFGEKCLSALTEPEIASLLSPRNDYLISIRKFVTLNQDKIIQYIPSILTGAAIGCDLQLFKITLDHLHLIKQNIHYSVIIYNICETLLTLTYLQDNFIIDYINFLRSDEMSKDSEPALTPGLLKQHYPLFVTAERLRGPEMIGLILDIKNFISSMEIDDRIRSYDATKFRQMLFVEVLNKPKLLHSRLNLIAQENKIAAVFAVQYCQNICDYITNITNRDVQLKLAQYYVHFLIKYSKYGDEEKELVNAFNDELEAIVQLDSPLLVYMLNKIPDFLFTPKMIERIATHYNLDEPLLQTIPVLIDGVIIYHKAEEKAHVNNEDAKWVIKAVGSGSLAVGAGSLSIFANNDEDGSEKDDNNPAPSTPR